MKNVFIHPLALVETDDIGAGTRVWAYTHILPGARVGRNCNIGEHCFLEGGATVGDNVTIKNGNMLWAGLVIESGVFVGPQVLFTNDVYPRSPRLPQARHRYDDTSWLVPTLIEEGASLGAGAIVLPGVRVGRFAMVAAGAVATKDVPPYALLKGNPGRVGGWVCQCGRPLSFDTARAICAFCGLSFQKNSEGVQSCREQESRQLSPSRL